MRYEGSHDTRTQMLFTMNKLALIMEKDVTHSSNCIIRINSLSPPYYKQQKLK